MQRSPTRAASRVRRRGAGRWAAAQAVGDGRRVRPSPMLLLCGNVRGRDEGARLDLTLDLVELGLEFGGALGGFHPAARALAGGAVRQRSTLDWKSTRLN